MADFYGTASGADAYFAARGITTWAGTNDAKEAALLKASVWLDGNYSTLFPGLRTNGRAQPREWPRTGAIDAYGYAIDPDLVPPEIEMATYEAALRELVTPGALNVDYTAAEGIKSVSIDGALSVTFNGANSAADVQLQISSINQILYPILSKQAAIAGGLSGRTIRW